MTERGKEVRPMLDPASHEKLCIIAEFEGCEIAVLAANLLEKTIAGEWHRYERFLARANDIQQREEVEHPAKKAGFVYVIRVRDRYKIGKAIDWRKRISNAMFSEPPQVVCVIETDDRHVLEKELHGKYGALRRHGEWFDLTPVHVRELLSAPGAKEIAA
jgi:hypothetical protein